MKKEFVFSAKFDTSDFDRSIEMMQRKLKEVYAPSDTLRMQQQTAQRLQSMGLGGIISAPGQSSVNAATMAGRREMDRSIAEEAKQQEKLGKLIANRSDLLKKMRDQQKEMISGSKEELAIKEKIARVEENNYRLRENYKQRNEQLNNMMNARESMRPQGMDRIVQAYQGGGIGGAARAGWRMFGQNPMGYLGGALSGVGYAMNRGAEMYRDYASGPIRTEQAMGSAVSNTVGRDVQNIYGRRTAFENMFLPERSRAAQMALEKLSANQLADRMGLAGNLGMIAGGGMMAVKGGSMGGAVGSAVPILGTGLGTAIGAAPGVITAGKGIFDLMGNERRRSLLLSPFSSTANRRYESMLAQELGQDYNNAYEAQKQQNPFKTAAVAEYEQNFMRNLGAQRSMGIGNEQFYGQGGFLRQGIGAGFTPEMMMEMSSGILGAGGSSRGAFGTAMFGNQLARGLNLTNAGQVLGTLSGGIGDAGGTREATIKILAEGMKIGLDGTKFAEEQRRFTAIAADIIAKSGATSATDFERISGGFGRFVAEQSNMGISAAQSAYQQYQQISSTTSGPRGVMRQAGFMSSPELRQLSTIEKQALMQVPEGELNTNNQLVAGLAAKYGIPVEQFVSSIQKVNEGAVSRFSEHDKIRDRLREGGVDIGRAGSDPQYRESLTKEQRDDITSLLAYQTTEHGYKGQRQMTAFGQGTVGPSGKSFSQEELEAGIEDQIAAPGGKIEDKTIRSMAADSGTILSNFNKMKTDMEKAAEYSATINDKMREAAAELVKALEEARVSGKGDLTAIQRSVRTMQNLQPQGAKPSK